MRHRAKGRQLSRTASHKKALLRISATSLFRHDRIVTTEAKAKELRPYADGSSHWRAAVICTRGAWWSAASRIGRNAQALQDLGRASRHARRLHAHHQAGPSLGRRREWLG